MAGKAGEVDRGTSPWACAGLLGDLGFILKSNGNRCVGISMCDVHLHNEIYILEQSLWKGNRRRPVRKVLY